MESKEELFVSLGIFALIVAMVFLAVKCEKCISSDKYNNGNCECGGHYEYLEAVGHKYSTTYIFFCNKCGRRIEISYLPK